MLLLLACRVTDVGVDAALDPDGDGFGPEEDCAPMDAEVYPGAEETWYDGVDQSCSGNDFDQDGDGFASATVPNQDGVVGTDCDDLNANINPGAAELCNTGIDEDCSGDDNGCSLAGEALAAEADYVYTGPTDTYFGHDLTSGDWNDDGHIDLAIGAYYAENSGGMAEAGRVHVVYGPLPTSVSLEGITGVVFEGRYAYDDLGCAVESGGDLDNDGTMDLIMGARRYDDGGMSNNGAVMVVYGGPTWLGTIPADMADAIIYGEKFDDGVGQVSQFIGDIDGDGCDDFGLGSGHVNQQSGDSEWAVYIVSGNPQADYGVPCDADVLRHSGSERVTNVSVRVFMGDPGDLLGDGRHVSGAFDLDADGLDDFAMSSIVNSGKFQNGGTVYVVYGDAGFFGLEEYDPVFGARLVSEVANVTFLSSAADDNLGHGLGSPGDVDGDGYDDLMIGAQGYDDPARGLTNSGGVFLISGGPSRLEGDLPITEEATATVTGAASDDTLGWVVTGGDINRDGLDDIVLNSVGYDHDGKKDVGAVFVFHGPVVGDLVATDADAILVGPSSGTDWGMYTTVFDANGDGAMDIFVGARLASTVYGYLGGTL